MKQPTYIFLLTAALAVLSPCCRVSAKSSTWRCSTSRWCPTSKSRKAAPVLLVRTTGSVQWRAEGPGFVSGISAESVGAFRRISIAFAE